MKTVQGRFARFADTVAYTHVLVDERFRCVNFEFNVSCSSLDACIRSQIEKMHVSYRDGEAVMVAHGLQTLFLAENVKAWENQAKIDGYECAKFVVVQQYTLKDKSQQTFVARPIPFAVAESSCLDDSCPVVRACHATQRRLSQSPRAKDVLMQEHGSGLASQIVNRLCGVQDATGLLTPFVPTQVVELVVHGFDYATRRAMQYPLQSVRVPSEYYRSLRISHAPAQETTGSVSAVDSGWYAVRPQSSTNGSMKIESIYPDPSGPGQAVAEGMSAVINCLMSTAGEIDFCILTYLPISKMDILKQAIAKAIEDARTKHKNEQLSSLETAIVKSIPHFADIAALERTPWITHDRILYEVSSPESPSPGILLSVTARDSADGNKFRIATK